MFCGVFPGDGFSARLEDSILHGCIPVIVQDGILVAWENVLNFSRLAVRLTEEEIPNLVERLKAISEEERRDKWNVIQQTWQRWSYHSVVKREGTRQKLWYGHEWGEKFAGFVKDDAIDTLFQACSLSALLSELGKINWFMMGGFFRLSCTSFTMIHGGKETWMRKPLIRRLQLSP